MDSYLSPLFCSTGLHICFCASTPPCCFYCYGSVVQFEVGYCDISSVALFCSALPWLLSLFANCIVPSVTLVPKLPELSY
jgi:hypothetical protein